MSLLIKALEKAEKNKGTDDKNTSLAGNLSLEPINEIDDEKRSLEAQAGFANASTLSKQKAAATMFAAKTVQVNNTRSNLPLILAIGLLLLVLIGSGFYYYLQSMTQPTLVMPNAVAPTPRAEEPTSKIEPTTAQAPTITENTEQAELAPAPKDVSNQAPVTEPQELAPRASTSSFAEAKPTTIGQQQEAPISNEPRKKSAIKTPANALSVVSNPSENGINPSLLAAYQAFNAGDDKGAQQLYRQVLQSDVRNIDALLGMAAIAARQGRANDALGWYGKVLEIEPRNSVAQASMVSLIGQADPVSSESKIKNLIAQQPQAAHLHAALGNFYAEQNQWPAAQQSYFEAYHLDAKNPDYAFNLAISLDQMGKNMLALKYYKEAQALLNNNVGNIDRVQLESRIIKLEQSPTQ